MYKNARAKRGADKIQLLYLAREKALIEKNWPMLESICNTLISSQSSDNVQNILYIALSQYHQNQYPHALALLSELNDKLNSPVHYYWHQVITGNIYAKQALTFQAIPYYFRASEIAQKHEIDANELNQKLWSELTKLSSLTLEQFNTGSGIQQGWINLALYSQLYIGDPVSLHSAMNNWQKRYPRHPASFALPDKMKSLMAIEPYRLTKLAVLLPETGKNARIGEAVKNGILAASEISNQAEIHYINSIESIDKINEQINIIQPDFIIGPLLKSNIDKVKQSEMLVNYPTIFLNSNSQKNNSLEHYYFALSPEHELTQAINHFVAKDFKKPLLLVPKNKSGERLVASFTQQWQQYSKTQPEIGFYADKKDMQKQVKKLLEVDESQKRINKVKLFFREKVKSDTRSRRDIDVIYLIGDAVQTRLLKPYFDVNISTFSAKIPMYASSKSHSLQVDKTDKRDLAGLYFTEIPWMLPQGHTQPALRAQFDKLWPQQGDLQQRLFAMGYDAVKLIPQLKQLSTLSGKSIQGLTGLLSINEQRQIHRQLQWARYYQKSIKVLSLKEVKPTPLFLQPPETID
ncbi:penicillin-binding protein activator [Pseudoalteromonas sp. NBT06-2]|uniref:penicillin-binding protein activator n=1 Tax=Pseudoalteromonas sp. NBT06-2 TaxID=2025950 RepID=UPI002074EC12|nr:penicillin-binding protein activator [Pseudoalteromonas sp. NBT06-2]